MYVQCRLRYSVIENIGVEYVYLITVIIVHIVAGLIARNIYVRFSSESVIVAS